MLKLCCIYVKFVKFNVEGVPEREWCNAPRCWVLQELWRTRTWCCRRKVDRRSTKLWRTPSSWESWTLRTAWRPPADELLTPKHSQVWNKAEWRWKRSSIGKEDHPCLQAWHRRADSYWHLNTRHYFTGCDLSLRDFGQQTTGQTLLKQRHPSQNRRYTKVKVGYLIQRCSTMNTCLGPLYNLGSGSWLAWANDTAAHYAAIHCPRYSEQLDPRCSMQTYHRPNQLH